LGRRPLGAILHSSNEPGELSQWLCHDDSTINIVVLIIIIIIIITVIVLAPNYRDDLPTCRCGLLMPVLMIPDIKVKGKGKNIYIVPLL